MKPTIRYKGLIASSLALLMLAACSGTKSHVVQEFSQNDKHMSCTDLELEITEAEFLRDKAEKNRGASMRNVLMPLSYPSTYMNSNKAEDAASGRLAYLSRLHEIKGCNAQQMVSGYGEAEMGMGYAPEAGYVPSAHQYPQAGYAAPHPQQHYGMPQRGYRQPMIQQPSQPYGY